MYSLARPGNPAFIWTLKISLARVSLDEFRISYKKFNFFSITLFHIFNDPRSHKRKQAGVDLGVLSKHRNIKFCRFSRILIVFSSMLTQVSALFKIDGIRARSQISSPARAPPTICSRQSSMIDLTSLIAAEIRNSRSFIVAFTDAARPSLWIISPRYLYSDFSFSMVFFNVSGFASICFLITFFLYPISM